MEPQHFHGEMGGREHIPGSLQLRYPPYAAANKKPCFKPGEKGPTPQAPPASTPTRPVLICHLPPPQIKKERTWGTHSRKSSPDGKSLSNNRPSRKEKARPGELQRGSHTLPLGSADLGGYRGPKKSVPEGVVAPFTRQNNLFNAIVSFSCRGLSRTRDDFSSILARKAKNKVKTQVRFWLPSGQLWLEAQPQLSMTSELFQS